MKFIGQYIQHFIARFRNDVYLEEIDTGTIASGGNLGLDSNNKIVKADVPADGDITSVKFTSSVGTHTESSGDAEFILAGSNGLTFTNVNETFTVTASNASTSIKGVASFNSENFIVSSGAVNLAPTISIGNVTVDDKIQHDGDTDTFIHFGNGGDDTITLTTGNVEKLYITNSNTVFNETGSDIDFRVEASGEANALFVQGSDGNVGIGTSSPSEKLEVNGNISIGDNDQIKFGANNDLKIYHNSSLSRNIIDSDVGDLYINQNANDKDIIFRCDDGSGGTETYFYLDGSLSSGNPFTVFPDESRLAIGDDADMIIYHNGSSSFITQKGTGDLYITNSTNDKDIIFQSDDGAGGLANYFRIDGSQAAHDGSASTALYTTWIDNSRIALGTDRDLHLHHTGSNSKITNYTGNLEIINNADDGDIKFSSDDGSGGTTEYLRIDGGDEKVKALKQLEVTGGVELTNGNLNMPDNSAIRLGSSTDLQIYHDGSNSFIVDAGTGDLLNYFSNEWKVIKYGSSETCIEATSDGSVDLYYDNSKKFETTSTGVDITGNIASTGRVISKQYQAYSANFLDDLGTDKHYLPIVDSPNEQTIVYRHEAAMTAPCDGRIASVTIRFENLNTHSGDANVTVGVESRVAGVSYAGTWTVEETETVAIPDTADHDTVHFQFANAKHFDSAELFAVSIQSDTDITGTNERFWVTVVVEWDWSTYLGTEGTSTIYSSTP